MILTIISTEQGAETGRENDAVLRKGRASLTSYVAGRLAQNVIRVRDSDYVGF